MMKLKSIITYPNRNEAYTRYEDDEYIHYSFIPLVELDHLLQDYTYDIVNTTGENKCYRNIKHIEDTAADQVSLLDKFQNEYAKKHNGK